MENTGKRNTHPPERLIDVLLRPNNTEQSHVLPITTSHTLTTSTSTGTTLPNMQSQSSLLLGDFDPTI